MPDYQDLKNRTRISTTMENDVYRRLKEYSDKSSVPITKILDKAVVMYLDNVDSK